MEHTEGSRAGRRCAAQVALALGAWACSPEAAADLGPEALAFTTVEVQP